MRKKNLFLFIAFMVVSKIDVASQNYFPAENVSQKWEYVIWKFWGGQCQKKIIKNGKSTHICKGQYIEILDCDENEENCILLGYYRNQNDSVLIRTNHLYLNGVKDTVVCDEPEGLMYDFGVKIAETLKCQINSTWPPTFTDFWKIHEQSVEYEGVNRLTHTMRYRPHPNVPDFTYTMKWIEGIGSDVHPFYSLTCIGDHCEMEQLMTNVYINDTLIYQDSTYKVWLPCTGWTSSSSDNNIQKTVFRIIPNPTNHSFIIDSPGNQESMIHVQMYCLNGKIISDINDYQSGQTIDTEFLSSGMYMVRIQSALKVQNIKLIKGIP